MASVGYATIQLIPSIEGFSDRVREQIGAPVDEVSKSAGARSGGLFGGSWVAAMGHILAAGAVYQLGSDVANGFGSAVMTGLKGLSFQQTANAALSTLTGSASTAKDLFTQLQNFAAATPFSQESAVTSAEKLIGAGASAKDVIPTLKALGDANAAVGATQSQFNDSMLAYTQIMARGKLDTQDLYQLSTAGIPIWKELAKAVGVPTSQIQDMVAKGKLLSDTTLPKLKAQMEKDYGGAMIAQSHTLAGEWSNLTDTLTISLTKAFQPLAPFLEDLIPKAANVASKAILGISHGLVSLVDGIKKVIDSPLVQSFMQPLKEMFTGLAPLIPVVVGSLSPLLSLIPRIGGTLGFLTGPFGVLVSLFVETVAHSPALQGALKTLVLAFSPLGDILQIVVQHLGPFLQAMGQDFTTVLTVLGNALAQLIPSILPLVNSIVDLAGTFSVKLLPAILPVIELLAGQFVNVIVKLVQTLLPPMVKFISDLATNVGDFLTQLAPVVTQLVTGLAPVADQLVKSLLPPLVQAFKDLIKAIAPLLNDVVIPLVKELTKELVPAIKNLVPVVISTAKDLVPIIKGLGETIDGLIKMTHGALTGNWREAWSGAKEWTKGQLDETNGIIKASDDIAKGLIKAGAADIKNEFNAGLSQVPAVTNTQMVAATVKMQQGVDNITGVTRGLKGKLQISTADAESWLAPAGMHAAQGFIDGFSSKAAAIQVAMSTPIVNGQKAINSFLKIQSPSRLFMAMADFTAQGFIIGLQNRTTDVQSAYLSTFAAPDIAGSTLAAGSALSAKITAAVTAANEKPIHMPDGTLFGWIKTIANGESQLVLNQEAQTAAAGYRY